MQKLVPTLIEDIIDSLENMNRQIKNNPSYHIDPKHQKEDADTLRAIADLLDPPEIK